MKKILSIFMMGIILMGFCGCDGTNSIEDNKNPENNNQDTGNGSQNENNNENQGVTGERKVEVDYENLTISVPNERNIRIAQFADLHFSVESLGGYSNDKEERTKMFMKQIVDETKPDLIVLSGDNLYGRSTNTGLNIIDNLKRFLVIMESLKTPYVFAYGNHDAEEITDGSNKVAMNNYLLNAIKNQETKYLLYGNECSEPNGKDYRDIRYGTYAIKLRDLDSSDLTGAIIIFDSGYYDARISSYNSVSQTQIDWYENKIATLQEEYKGDGVVPTIIINHIQLPQFYNAYVNAYMQKFPNYTSFGDSETPHYQYSNYADVVDSEANNKYEFTLFQDVTKINDDNDWVYMIKHGGPLKPTTDLWSKMVELGSTKAFFSGHDHNFDFQVKSHGIILGFAPQTGFAPAEATNWNPRVGYTYNFDLNLNLIKTDITNEDESRVLGDKLAIKYMDNVNGDSLNTVTTSDTHGNYIYKVTMKKQWSRIKLYFAGEVINLSDYTITGNYSTGLTGNVLYGTSDTLYYGIDGSAEFIITLNPIDKTLDIDLVGDEINDIGFVGEARYHETENTAEVVIVGTEVDGVYTITVNFAKNWGYIKLKFDGKYLSKDNTTYTGDYTNGNTAPDKLYFDPNETSYQLNASTKNHSFIITYNTATNTVNIQHVS